MAGFEPRNVSTRHVWSGEGGTSESEIVWDDVLVNSGLFQFRGTSDPTWRDWTVDSKTFRALFFNSGDEIYFSIQLPHTYKEGMDIRPHVHWTDAGNGSSESGHTVAWKLDYTWANVHDNFSTSGTIDMTGTCSGSDDYHEVGAATSYPSGTGKEISSMLFCRLYRDSGDTWSGTGSSGPALLQFDFHIPISSDGSRQEWIKDD